MRYFVYVLRCRNGAYYTGYTRNIERRMRQHMRGIGSRYVRTHKPERIVYTEEFETRSQAMKREREIKQLSRAKKDEMVRAFLRKTSARRASKRLN